MKVLRQFPDLASPAAACAPRSRDARELRLECIDVHALARHVTAWADLCARALEPNIFLDPAFALPLYQNAGPGERTRFLLAWEPSAPIAPGRLLGLFVLDLPRRRSGTCRLSLHKQTSKGSPLVDEDSAGQVIEAALDWLGSGAAALAITSIAGDGPFADALRQVCATSSRPLVVLEEHNRAVLNSAVADVGRVASFASARRRKQYARQARRLARNGTRTLTSASSPAELAVATERFLALEQASWKGAAGTALRAQPGLARFARSMTRLMGREGRCRIDAVEIDGRAVAMGIILTDRGRAHFWKIAFDEAYALFSPGVQLALAVTERQLADPTVAVTDSCAEANHPMIDRLWPDRIVMIDLILGLAPGRSAAFSYRLCVERTRRALRRRAKTIWHSVRRTLDRRSPRGRTE